MDCWAWIFRVCGRNIKAFCSRTSGHVSWAANKRNYSFPFASRVPEFSDVRENAERRPTQARMERSPHLSIRRHTSSYAHSHFHSTHGAHHTDQKTWTKNMDFHDNGEQRPSQARMERSPHLSIRRYTSSYAHPHFPSPYNVYSMYPNVPFQSVYFEIHLFLKHSRISSFVGGVVARERGAILAACHQTSPGRLTQYNTCS